MPLQGKKKGQRHVPLPGSGLPIGGRWWQQSRPSRANELRRGLGNGSAIGQNSVGQKHHAGFDAYQGRVFQERLKQDTQSAPTLPVRLLLLLGAISCAEYLKTVGSRADVPNDSVYARLLKHADSIDSIAAKNHLRLFYRLSHGYCRSFGILARCFAWHLSLSLRSILHDDGAAIGAGEVMPSTERAFVYAPRLGNVYVAVDVVAEEVGRMGSRGFNVENHGQVVVGRHAICQPITPLRATVISCHRSGHLSLLLCGGLGGWLYDSCCSAPACQLAHWHPSLLLRAVRVVIAAVFRQAEVQVSHRSAGTGKPHGIVHITRQDKRAGAVNPEQRERVRYAYRDFYSHRSLSLFLALRTCLALLQVLLQHHDNLGIHGTPFILRGLSDGLVNFMRQAQSGRNHIFAFRSRHRLILSTTNPLVLCLHLLPVYATILIVKTQAVFAETQHLLKGCAA